MSESAALALAEQVCALRANALPDAVREAALRCVLDLIGAAAAGSPTAGAQAARRAAQALAPAGDCGLWFTDARVGPLGALLANSTAAAAQDLDDGHRLARGHPGAAVIPAAFAVGFDGTRPPVGADDLLAAIVAGYEAGVRVAMARPSYAPSGAWSPFAVIAAAGRLTKASPGQIAQAFGIAAQWAPGLPGLAGIVGSDVKEGIGWGCVTGLAALQLACADFTGPQQIFDMPALFARAPLLAEADAAPMITQTYFKPYAACRHAHAALDAYQALAQRHGFTADQVQAVTVHTYAATFNLANRARPRTLVEAQYSVPFCLAVAAVRGADALVPMSPALLADAAVQGFADRVTVVRDPTLDAVFPARSPARVTVQAAGRTHESPVTDPLGDPARPLSWGELEAKFRTATRQVLTARHQAALLDGIGRLRDGDPSPLVARLHAGPRA